MKQQYRALVETAARLYLGAGRYPYHFARGKLGRDPVFPTLLSRGVIPNDARILDLGCGQGCLAALLIAARSRFNAGAWPAGWPAPPHNIRLHGIELQDRVASWARTAFGDLATIDTGDLCEAALPDADVVVILDVLHYLEPHAQVRALERIAHTLRAGGTLLLRVGDTLAGWPFFVTRFADKFSTLVRGQGWPSHYCRPVAEWTGLLEKLGFQVEAEPMARGTPFANVLLTARIG